MAGGGRRPAAWKYELLKGRQSSVESIQCVLDPQNMGRLDHSMTRDAQFAAEVEKVMLHFRKTAGDGARQVADGQYHADGAIDLIDRAVGFDTQTFLEYARSVAETGSPIVTGPRINLTEAVPHSLESRSPTISSSGCDGSTRFVKVARMKPSPELQAALDAADQAALIARSLYRHNLEVRIKADKSPVTEADVRCETAIREILEARFPTYGFYGEETGSHHVDADNLWLVDPIDGTKAFVREYSMFSTQIALMRGGELVLGVSSAPVYGEIAFAERGCGAYLNGQAVGVSEISAIETAALSSGNMKSLAKGPQWKRYGQLVAQVNRIRGYGDFLHYHLLASGKIDAVIESDVNILDIAACVAIVTEAGGRFTDLSGAPITLESTSVLATNGLLHEPVLRALA